MTDPVYNLSLSLLPTGDLVAAKSAPAAGAQYLYPMKEITTTTKAQLSSLR